MTAAASPTGRLPLSPPPPQKPMLSHHGKGRRRRGTCLGGLSCFGGSPVTDSDSGHPDVAHRRAASGWFAWSRFRKKKKTVPVDSSPAELITPGKIIPGGDQVAGEDEAVASATGKGSHGGKEEEEEPGKQRRWPPVPNKKTPPPGAAAAVEVRGQSFLLRLRKGNKDATRSKTQPSRTHKNGVNSSDSEQQRRRRQQQPQQQPRLPFISPKYNAALFAPERSRNVSRAAPTAPAAAACSPSVSSPATTLTPAKPTPNQSSASRLGGGARAKKPEEPSRYSSSFSRNDQVLGLSVMAVVLLMMVLFGRVTAIVCTCVWFYYLPRLRATVAEKNGGGSKGAAGVDLDSEEYKKRIVLEGLLQRNGRRASGLS